MENLFKFGLDCVEGAFRDPNTPVAIGMLYFAGFYSRMIDAVSNNSCPESRIGLVANAIGFAIFGPLEGGATVFGSMKKALGGIMVVKSS